MNLTSKKAPLVILGVLAILFSRFLFLFSNDPEGPNLLIVLVAAIVVYGLFLTVYFYFPTKSRFLSGLIVVYGILFLVLAVNPIDRATWFAENLTVWIILAVILILYWCGVRLSRTAYALMFVLIYLHTIGGHYTFALVPFDYVTNLFHFSRNHFDRIAHFSVGFYAFGIAEWLYSKRMVSNKFLLFTYPIFVIVTVAASYEIIEWLYAAGASPESAADYLGSQGDIWDAQKDMLADTLGAIVATTGFFIARKPKLK